MKILSMRGKEVDMGQLMARNATKVALGNANMNARGDVVTKAGQIVVPREQVAREYHRSNPKAVKQVALRDIKQEVLAFDSPAQAMAKQREAMMAAVQKDKKQQQRKIVDND